MSRAHLRASLALWRRRLLFRQRRLKVSVRHHRTASARKWRRLVDEAHQKVSRRERQLAAARPLRVKAWHIAGQLVGDTESAGHNRGPAVDKVIRYAQGDLGEAYCVDGVIYSYGKAGSKIVKPGFPRAVRMMLVTGVRKILAPRVGDIVRFTFDHTGLFGGWYRQRPDGSYVRSPRLLATHLRTREFNTSALGALSSDANDGTDGIYEKYRAKSLVSDFLRVHE